MANSSQAILCGWQEWWPDPVFIFLLQSNR